MRRPSIFLSVTLGVVACSGRVHAQVPEGHWPFDSDGIDVSGNSRHASLRNGAAIQNGSAMIGSGCLGGEGPGGTLDGAAVAGNDLAETDGAGTGFAWEGVPGAGARSVSLWFKAPASQPNTIPTLISWGTTATGARYDLRFDRSGGTGGGVGFPADCLRLEIAGNYICTTAGGYLDDAWHHVLTCFPGGGTAADYSATRFYVDGKPVAHTPSNSSTGVNTGVGNNVLMGHSVYGGDTRSLLGQLDDVGIYAADLAEADAALIHGLGRIHGIALDQLPAAQALWTGPVGSTGSIGGKTWIKAAGLPGALGDIGGLWALNTAYIVLDDSGGGIQLTVPGETLVWNGTPPGDGVDLFSEGNWREQGTGLVPQAGSVDPDADVLGNLRVTQGTPGGAPGAAGNLQLGGFQLAIQGGSLRLDVSGGYGIRDDAVSGDDTTRSAVLVSGGLVLAEFLGEIRLTLSSNGMVALTDGTDPLPGSVVEFLTNTCSLVLSNRTPNQVVGSLGQISVLGGPAVVGADPEAPEFGDTLLISAQDSGSSLRALLGPDIDQDGLADTWEMQYFSNLLQTATDDPDDDTLSNLDEQQRGTHPDNGDTDGDGLADNVETGTGVWISAGNTGTDPTDWDSDDDGLRDGVESRTGVFVSALDTGTDPNHPNSDGDRFKDGSEVARGTDPNSASSQPDLPNVILIMADDLGVGELGCYGQTKIRTPHLDQMAADGMKFMNMYTTTAVCAPARCQLLTGKHAGRAYIRNNRELSGGNQLPIPEGTFTLGHLMQNAGYVTACIGKWGLGGPGTTGEPNRQGFDHFFGYLGQVQAHHYYPSFLYRNTGKAYYSPTLAAAEGGTVDIPGAANETGFDNLALSLGNKNNNGNVHSHDAMVREAMQWITAHQDEAFFLYLAPAIPHTSIQVPGHIDDLQDGDGIVFDNSVRTCKDEFYPTNPVTGLRPFGAPIAHPGSGHYSATPDKRHDYAAMISAMDRDVGRIRALLQTLGLSTNTLIVFTSDNGTTFLGEVDYTFFESVSGLRGLKNSSYEGGIREPYLFCWPGRIPAGGVNSNVIGAHDDMMPTLGELTGAAHPADVTGHSILPTLLGRPAGCQTEREYLYFEFQESGGWTRTVRKGDWKLRRYTPTGSTTYTRELYNLALDRAEATNVFGANPGIGEELERYLDGSHQPAEHFFRPTDELAQRNGVTLSYGTLGLRLSGTGEGLVWLARDITSKVTFKLAIENSGGATANGAFLFGRGSNTGDLIRAEVDGAAGLYRLSGGGASVALPIPGAFAATDRYDLNVEWDPASSTVSLRHLTNSVQLVVSPPPATVDHIGYAVDNAQTDFTPVTICLDAPPLVSRGWCRPDGLFRLRYQRPATQTGSYSHEASTNLLHWTVAPVGRVQAVTGFGELQQVSADFPDRSRAAGAPPQLFYRIHYTP